MTKFRTIAVAAGALVLALALWNVPSGAQPLYDRINVTLPYTVTLGDKTLPPGDYVIQQLASQAGGSRVLLIYSDKGMKFETSALTIPALENKTQADTKIMLHHMGPDYYFDKVWVQGKDYGYEFPLPDSVKAREKERMAAVSVPATYSTTPDTETTTATAEVAAPKATVSEPVSEPAKVTEPEPTPEPVAEPTPTPEPAPMPQAAPPPQSAPATPAPAPASQPTETLPATSAGWLMMLVGGSTLSGAGLMLRRKR